jgi:hypothetical protein
MLDETCHQVLMTDRHLYPIQWNAIDHLSAADQVTVVALFRRAFLYGVVTPDEVQKQLDERDIARK